jgi:hypothetical protein
MSERRLNYFLEYMFSSSVHGVKGVTIVLFEALIRAPANMET